MVYLDQNGETATDSISDEETAEQLLNFVFVGANIVTGKSSIRTKASSKKVSSIQSNSKILNNLKNPLQEIMALKMSNFFNELIIIDYTAFMLCEKFLSAPEKKND